MLRTISARAFGVCLASTTFSCKALCEENTNSTTTTTITINNEDVINKTVNGGGVIPSNSTGKVTARKVSPWKEGGKYDNNVIEPSVSIISGTANKSLSQRISTLLGRDLSNVDIHKFSDGEISIQINESMRGKDVFIIQTCSPPVNDRIMELILSVAAAKRSGATTITAIIPYFGYKLNRRGLPISSTHHTRFLWNAAGDLAKMLQVAGVDKVISVDLQRTGQGHEACFLKAQLPAETISTNDLFVDYFQKKLDPTCPIVIVAANIENAKKAKKYQKKLSLGLPTAKIDCAAFLRTDAESTIFKGAQLELQGDVKGKDVVLIEDYIDSAVHVSILCNKLMKEGANRVFVCASHGHFDSRSMRLIDLSPVSEVVISDSIALPEHSTAKIVQLSIAPLLATVIKSDVNSALFEFNQDNTEEDYVADS
eukprot:gene4166-4579_t